ncbi:M17 family metallopeptidase [Spiroplasma endosymbiont of Aspidapion aeneum]|uniref:M17 family metallopeptidase n=1 Tax=Spiroplasma endosymbiont of Aspidapion aeneum TaxID=3066276 RepID=UPI00313BEEFF
MITTNKKNDYLKLIAIEKEEVKNDQIVNKCNAITQISEDKTFYYRVDRCKNMWKLADTLEEFIENKRVNLCVHVDTFIKSYGEEAVRVIVETIAFAARERLSYKSQKSDPIFINFDYDQKYENIVKESLIKVEYMTFAGRLQDTPPNIGTATYFADELAKKAKEVEGVKVTILTKKEIQSLNMGLLLSVNAASPVEPRVVVFEYCSDPKREKIGFVGKGITFDTGGNNLKPSLSMVGMKMDMSGAAIVLSSVLAMAKAKIKTNVVAIGMFTDNRIDGNATLTESIVKSMEGTTIEIDNTDAEGRLVLADGLHYAIDKFKVNKIVDIATLTGAMLYSLGSFYTGLFSTDDAFANDFLQKAKIAREDVWRLPLDCRHLESMKNSKLADMTNTGKRSLGAGSSTAAAFLNHFTKEIPFVHLDIAATEGMDKGYGNGVMLRTFFELAK